MTHCRNVIIPSPCRAKATGERVNIHTQTRRPAPADSNAAERETRALYQESDIDWKTHSLPSLGRVSSEENTLNDSGSGCNGRGVGDDDREDNNDDYSIRKSLRRARRNAPRLRCDPGRRAMSMNVGGGCEDDIETHDEGLEDEDDDAGDGDREEEGDETEMTHNESEELDRYLFWVSKPERLCAPGTCTIQSTIYGQQLLLFLSEQPFGQPLC